MGFEAVMRECRTCRQDFASFAGSYYCSPDCKIKATRESRNRWRAANRESVVAQSRRYAAENTERYSEYSYKRRYGLTFAQVEAMWSGQGGQCAICREAIRLRGAKGRDKAVVDHCHATSRVRGLLCTPCNLMIGYAADDKRRLVSAVQYLEGDAVETAHD